MGWYQAADKHTFSCLLTPHVQQDRRENRKSKNEETCGSRWRQLSKLRGEGKKAVQRQSVSISHKQTKPLWRSKKWLPWKLLPTFFLYSILYF